MCVCVNIYVYYIYVYTHTHIFMYIIYTHIHTYISLYIYNIMRRVLQALNDAYKNIDRVCERMGLNQGVAAAFILVA